MQEFRKKFIDKTKLIIKNVLLNLNFIFENKLTLILFFLFILFPVLLSIVIIPPSMLGPFYFVFTCAIPMMISFGFITYNFKHSTLYKNLKTTKNSSSIFYISSYITINIISIILYLILFIILIILNATSLMKLGWLKNSTSPDQINIFRMNWFDTFYILFIYGLLCFSFSYFLSSFIDNQKTYYIIIMIVTIIMIIFGGLINSYFGVIEHSKELNKKWGSVELHFGTTTFPKEIFFETSILFPFYNTGQMAQILTRQITNVDDMNNVEMLFNAFFWKGINFTNAFNWGFVMVMPYFHIIFFGILGSIINIKRKK